MVRSAFSALFLVSLLLGCDPGQPPPPTGGICTQDGKLVPASACTNPAPTPPPGDPGKPCVVGGCSGQVCADEPLASTCEWRAEYGCYKKTTCARQADGRCGWTPSPELTACLEAAKMSGSLAAP